MMTDTPMKATPASPCERPMIMPEAVAARSGASFWAATSNSGIAGPMRRPVKRSAANEAAVAGVAKASTLAGIAAVSRLRRRRRPEPTWPARRPAMTPPAAAANEKIASAHPIAGSFVERSG